MSDFKAPLDVGQMARATVGPVIEDLIATVLEITVEAWREVCGNPRISSRSKEDDITDCLRWEMVAAKNRRHPRPQLRFDRETQRHDPRRRYPTGLIDVYVVYSFDEADYFAMECKKVTDRHQRRAKYYVQEGVCRFSSGKYSAGHPYGAMIAFVTKGTVQSAARFLEGRLIAFDRSATRLRTGWGWKTEAGFGGIPDLYSTKHGQEGTRNTITLLHLFLPL